MRRIALLLLGLVALWSGVAEANWRDDLKVFRVGFLAGDNPGYRIAQMEAFRWQLQYDLAVPVELFPARSYEALIEAEATGRVQYAILSSLAFVALDQKCHCVEPLVQPTSESGARGFHAILLTEQTSPIKTLADARGARLAIGAIDSLSGQVVPMAGLAGEGIVPDGYFARVVQMADGKATVRALVDGDADIAATWSTATDPLSALPTSGPLAELSEENGISPGDLRLVWQSDLIPFGPHVIRTDLAPEARAELLRTLLNMQTVAPDAYDSVERGLSGGFIEADPLLYRRLAALLAAAKEP